MHEWARTASSISESSRKGTNTWPYPPLKPCVSNFSLPLPPPQILFKWSGFRHLSNTLQTRNDFVYYVHQDVTKSVVTLSVPDATPDNRLPRHTRLTEVFSHSFSPYNIPVRSICNLYSEDSEPGVCWGNPPLHLLTMKMCGMNKWMDL